MLLLLLLLQINSRKMSNYKNPNSVHNIVHSRACALSLSFNIFFSYFIFILLLLLLLLQIIILQQQEHK